MPLTRATPPTRAMPLTPVGTRAMPLTLVGTCAGEQAAPAHPGSSDDLTQGLADGSVLVTAVTLPMAKVSTRCRTYAGGVQCVLRRGRSVPIASEHRKCQCAECVHSR